MKDIYILGGLAVASTTVLLAIIAYKKKQAIKELIQSKEFTDRLHGWMVDAENYLESADGQAKLRWVVEKAVLVLPDGYEKMATELIIEAVNMLFRQYAVQENGHTIVK